MISREQILILAKQYWFVLACGVLILIVVLAYFSGYRIAPGGAMVKVGTISIEHVPEGAVVYLDEVRNHTVTGSSTSMNVLPGAHTVIVGTDDFQPWNELVTIEEGVTLHVTPLLVKKIENIEPKDISSGDMAVATRAMSASILPREATPLVLANGCISVYVSGNRILAKRTDTSDCTPPPYLCTDEGIQENGTCLPTIIFEPGEALRSLITYPERDDALILASGGLAYVIELDPRAPRFFAPLAKGTDIKVASSTTTSILVRSGFQLKEIEL